MAGPIGQGMVVPASPGDGNPPSAGAHPCFGSNSASGLEKPDNVSPRADSRNHVENCNPSDAIAIDEPVARGSTQKTVTKPGILPNGACAHSSKKVVKTKTALTPNTPANKGSKKTPATAPGKESRSDCSESAGLDSPGEISHRRTAKRKESPEEDSEDDATSVDGPWNEIRTHLGGGHLREKRGTSGGCAKRIRRPIAIWQTPPT